MDMDTSWMVLLPGIFRPDRTPADRSHPGRVRRVGRWQVIENITEAGQNITRTSGAMRRQGSLRRV